MPRDRARDERLRAHAYRRVALDGVAFGHEVRSPIAALAIRVELELEVETDDARRTFLSYLLDRCDEVGALTKGFLERARQPDADARRP